MRKSAYGTPLVVKDGADPVVLNKIEISDEKFIQELVFNYPSCLPISEIDRAYEELVPICMELNTPAGPLDALYATPTGRLVILEAKLWRNPEARRKVVAQILDYAKEFSRWDYEDLQRETSRKLGRKGNALFQLIAERFPDTNEAQFVDEVQHSLEQGRFLLLIVGDGIREGAGAIADFIGSVGSLEFTFGLVELALYENDAVGMVVQPRVIARTVEIERYVIQLPDGAYIEDEETQIARNDTELSESAQFYRSFWSEFLSELRLDDASQQLANPTRSENIYFKMPPTSSAAWVSAYFSKTTNTVGVYLRTSKKEVGDTYYRALLADKESIEQDLAFTPTWKEFAGSYTISVSKPFSDVHGAANRAAIKEFFAVNINLFVNVFRPRLTRIIEDAM
jgi:Domain of unknown function (DUF4268)